MSLVDMYRVPYTHESSKEVPVPGGGAYWVVGTLSKLYGGESSIIIVLRYVSKYEIMLPEPGAQQALQTLKP